MPELELDDIQGLVARGYPDLKAACYLMVAITDPARARPWLLERLADVTPGPAHPDERALNIAFTHAGVARLGLPTEALALFSNEFRTGMVTPHRRRILGDEGAAAPEEWLWGGPDTPAIDLLLALFARDEDTLETVYSTLRDTFADGGVTELTRLSATVDLDGREHFGFADGISQPTIAGLSSRFDTPPNTIRPGEFILGYENEYGQYTARPLVDAAADPEHVLPPDGEGSGQADFGRNGSYLVVRQLQQDVHAFWGYVAGATGDDPAARAHLAAKMVGRWPSGAPVALTPDADDPLLADANDFTYHRDDPLGLACPIGAHVRRAHPRDSLDPFPGTVRSVAVDKRHRLLRRGREYGPPLADPFAPPPADDPPRGLYFLALVGNIARQFEFIQHTWLNNPHFDGLYEEPDPLVGHRPESGAHFSIPGEPVRTRLTNLPAFVTVRGGGYFFLPGLRALRYLATRPT